MKIKKNEFVDEQGTVLDEGERYPAVVSGFGEISEGQYGPRLVWQFEIQTDEGEMVEAAAFSSYSMASGKKKSNLIAWTEAILGDIPDEGLELDDLIGKPCRVDISTYTKDNGIVKNKVTNVLPPKKGQKGKKVQASQETQKADSESDDFESIPF